MDLLTDPDPDIFAACERNSGPHKVVPEFLRSQIETNTRICATVTDVRGALVETRALVLASAAAHGAAVLACSTHPFAEWTEQAPTRKERYERFAALFQDAVRRMLIGGMHIHAGFGDDDERIRVMTALRRYLPFLHALSGSSPFSGGRMTGYKSYRLNLFGALPRTSTPAPLQSRAEYDRLVDEYRRLDFIGDGSELWWDIRPAALHPNGGAAHLRHLPAHRRGGVRRRPVCVAHPHAAAAGAGKRAAGRAADGDHPGRTGGWRNASGYSRSWAMPAPAGAWTSTSTQRR